MILRQTDLRENLNGTISRETASRDVASSNTMSTIRVWRRGKRLKLEAMCDLLEMRGIKRPSAAKLSRIERGQKIPSDMIGAFVSLTGIPAETLRPDLAESFAKLFGAQR